ncbi:MAG: leucine-rich repeat domain-containing protein, partial [Treponema sp.]|nr:leucine-rich repeat domain-containing protein [Treponema sp.]
SGTAFLRWEEGGTTYKGGKEYTVTRDVRFTATWGEFTRVDEVRDHLASFIDGEGATVADCIPVPVGIDFTSGGSDTWEALLEALETAGKYVALDLSQSTLTGMLMAGEFDPGTYNTGEPYIGSLTLPVGALSIKAGTSSSAPTFQHFTALKSISGENIETIGNYAFYDGDELSSVYLPVAKTIGTYAFYDGDGLSTVYLPVATSIGDYAFYDCDGLSTVNLPAVTSIGNYAFYDCDWLSSVYLPAATGIGTYAFQNCDRLSTVYLPVATSIGTNAFQDCDGLSSVNLPAATGIGDGAFANCNSLSSVILPVATSLGVNSFLQCAILKSVSLPKATIIKQGVFARCPQLSTVDLPEVKTIDRYAFEDSKKLSTVSLPKVTAINQPTSFQNCPLTSITISSGCNITLNQSILRTDFTTYYNNHGLRGGTYLYVGGAWTGPF